MTALPRPLNANGRSRQRWERWRAQQRAAVMARCGGRCEAPGCRNEAREAHHCFGRRHIIGEPLASHRSMLAGLCRECHHIVTVRPACGLAIHLEWTALERAVQEFSLPETLVAVGRPTDTVRHIERLLSETEDMDLLRQAAGL